MINYAQVVNKVPASESPGVEWSDDALARMLILFVEPDVWAKASHMNQCADRVDLDKFWFSLQFIL